MTRKTLVILRVLVGVYFVGTTIFNYTHTPEIDVGIFYGFIWLPVMIVVFLALTVWIDRIDARLNPKLPISKKEANTKAIISLIIVVVAIGILYWFTK